MCNIEKEYMIIDNVITLEQLTPLQDFPGYYIDLTNGDVYSHKAMGGWCNAVKLRRLEGKLMGRNNRNQQRCYTLKDKDGRIRYVAQGRLMIAASRGISYYVIPKDISCNYKDGEIVMRNRSEAAVEGWKDKLFEQNKHSIYNLRHDISCLTLLEKAFTGDHKPLFGYIHNKTDYYMKEINKQVHWGKKRAYVAIQMATDYLYEVIKGEHCAHIYALDRWFVRTAIGLWRKDEARRKHTDRFTKEKFQYRVTNNKDIYGGV